jgi:hypothetical protein
LFLAFLGGLLIFIIFSFIIYLSGLNTLVWIKFDLERWLFDESEFILFLSLPMSLIPFYFLFKNFRILYNEYLNKVIKKIEIDLERYFWDVESNYSDFVKELGGMDSVKDLILNLSSKDKIK